MNLVWAGRRYVNLDYLIMAEDADGGPAPSGHPTIRLMLVNGTVVHSSGEPAASIWRRLRELAEDGERGPPEPPEVETLEPDTGLIRPRIDPRPESA